MTVSICLSRLRSGAALALLLCLGACSGGGGDTGTANTATPPSDGGSASANAGGGPLHPFRLRADWQRAPLGLQTSAPRLGWAYDSATERGLQQRAYELQVASSIEQLVAGDADLWRSGVVETTDSSGRYGGPPLPSWTEAHWRVRARDAGGRWSDWSAPETFTIGLLSRSDWQAQWITAPAAAVDAPLPVFRREFAVDGPVRRAVAAVCGVGQYELTVNGQPASDAVLEPAWTDFRQSCSYSMVDVTALLTTGRNALGVSLGNGFYNVPRNARYTKFNRVSGALGFILQLRVEYADGRRQSVVTDTTWKTAPGSITFSNVYGGEDHDARLEAPGWNLPAFGDGSWQQAVAMQGFDPLLTARRTPPIKVMAVHDPVTVNEPAAGVQVLDLGQNFSGWPEIVVQGPAGSSVRLTPGEALRDGRVSQAGSGAPMWFAYTLKGGGPETWRPHFTTHGFRYVEVQGIAAPDTDPGVAARLPHLLRLTGQAVHSSAEVVGHFVSSDDDLNRIHALILGAIQSNLQSVLTDSPHREKLGWLETAHLMAPAILFNHDVAALYEKLIDDAAAAQTPSGLVPSIAPEYTVFEGDFRDSPEWGSALILNPWQLYQMTGDAEPLMRHYGAMQRYAAHLDSRSQGDLLLYGLGDWQDVGPAPPFSQLTSPGVTATAIWLQDLQTLSRTAQLLGRDADAAGYDARRATVLAAYTRRFLLGGRYDRGSQTAQAMPLALGLVPGDAQADVAAALVTSVRAAGHGFTAGDIGAAYVLQALMRTGHADEALAMLKQSTRPGYLYQIERGATTLTESWDANPSQSQNHAMLGHAETWFYNGLGGLQPDAAGPGFRQFVIAPAMPPGLASVAVDYLSAHGQIRSQWERGVAGLTLTVTVPPNTRATIVVPTAEPSAVRESGVAISSAPGVLGQSIEAGALRIEVGSGRYVFTAP